MPSKFLFDVDTSARYIDSVRAVVRDEMAPLAQRLSQQEMPRKHPQPSQAYWLSIYGAVMGILCRLLGTQFYLKTKS